MPNLAELEEKLDAATKGLEGVSAKKMFGCRALFRGKTIFAMVWKEGRLGFKLFDESAHAELLGLKGASTWSPGGKMIMSKWAFVPEKMHADAVALRNWAKRAHASALLAPAQRSPKPKPKKPVATARKKMGKMK